MKLIVEGLWRDDSQNPLAHPVDIVVDNRIIDQRELGPDHHHKLFGHFPLFLDRYTMAFGNRDHKAGSEKCNHGEN
jgi:phenylalanine-4-hydroxylase